MDFGRVSKDFDGGLDEVSGRPIVLVSAGTEHGTDKKMSDDDW